MESSVGSAISLYEKLTSSTTFLVIISAVLFTETFLSFTFSVDLFAVSVEWYQSNVQLRHLIYYLLWFSVCYGLVAPVLLVVLDSIINSKARSHGENDRNLIALNTLKYDAIIENNTVAFKYYENALTSISQTAYVRKLMIGIVALSVIGIVRWFASVNPSDGLISIVIEFLGQGDFISGAFRVFVLLLSGWFLAQLSSPSDEYVDSVYIKNYNERKIFSWMGEIECGLISKSELFDNLEQIRSPGSLASSKVEFDSENSAHAYCKKHGLLG